MSRAWSTSLLRRSSTWNLGERKPQDIRTNGHVWRSKSTWLIVDRISNNEWFFSLGAWRGWRWYCFHSLLSYVQVVYIEDNTETSDRSDDSCWFAVHSRPGFHVHSVGDEAPSLYSISWCMHILDTHNHRTNSLNGLKSISTTPRSVFEHDTKRRFKPSCLLSIRHWMSKLVVVAWCPSVKCFVNG